MIEQEVTQQVTTMNKIAKHQLRINQLKDSITPTDLLINTKKWPPEFII